MCGRWRNTSLSGAPALSRSMSEFQMPYPAALQHNHPLIFAVPPCSVPQRTLLSIGGATLQTLLKP